MIAAVGPTLSITHVKEVGGPVPAASVALTANVCGPCESELYTLGEVQDANVWPSRLHWSVACALLGLNSNLADVLVLGLCGVSVRVAIGRIVSIRHPYSVWPNCPPRPST